jgi:FixJ family two-component response regulator
MSEHAAVVFVIDDDPSMLRSLASLLRSVGLEARVFSSAPEFMRAQRPDAPGCLVLDLRMPGMDGLGLLRYLSGTGSRIPTVILTAHGDDEARAQQVSASISAWTARPNSVRS